MPVSIRLVDSLEAVEHFRVLEHLIWGEPLAATIPAHVIVTTIHNGGGLLAAYAEDGPAETGGMVGLTYWWPGLAVPTTMAEGKVVKANSPGAQASRLHAPERRLRRHRRACLPSGSKCAATWPASSPPGRVRASACGSSSPSARRSWNKG